ncbi:MAG: LysR family transcriptional regulator [Moraxella sp.]|nr:LysR family transcriptional regulator [Moraxella sp.]
MDTLTSLKVFTQVVKQGSFTKAADELNISNAMTSKHVAHLEQEVGAKLLQRNSRNLHLTEVGAEFFADAVHALETLEAASKKAASGRTHPTGTLKVSMPLWFANPKVATWLAQYRSKYPDVVLDLSLSNHSVDLIAEGFDLALRVTNEPKPALIARPLSPIDFFVVASPAYIMRHGLPTTPNELGKHTSIRPSYIRSTSFTLYQANDSTPINVSMPTAIHSNDTMMTLELVRAGAGISYLPAWLIEGSLADGSLVRLLPNYRLADITLYAVYADRTLMSAKVRSFIDFLVAKTGGG